MKVYNERKNKPVEFIRLGKKKIATLLTLETSKWEYSFATVVFTKLASLLSGTRNFFSRRVPTESLSSLVG